MPSAWHTLLTVQLTPVSSFATATPKLSLVPFLSKLRGARYRLPGSLLFVAMMLSSSPIHQV